MNRVGAEIVLFNPDKEKLRKNIDSVLPQVDRVVLVDNGSKDISWIDEVYAQSIQNQKIHIIRNGKNLGIAAALNQGMDYLSPFEDWVITLDQDSEICLQYSDSCTKLLNFYSSQKDGDSRLPIGMISPVIIDRNRKDQMDSLSKYSAADSSQNDTDPTFTELNRCITSGAFTSVQGWIDAGKFDEKMFIDLVDFDFSCRLKQAGYVIVRNENSFILHEVGNITMKGLRKKHVVYNHNPVRKYYFARNYIYMTRKNPSLHWRTAIYRISEQFLDCIFFEKDKKNKLHALCKGVHDGLRMKIEEK